MFAASKVKAKMPALLSALKNAARPADGIVKVEVEGLGAPAVGSTWRAPPLMAYSPLTVPATGSTVRKRSRVLMAAHSEALKPLKPTSARVLLTSWNIWIWLTGVPPLLAALATILT